MSQFPAYVADQLTTSLTVPKGRVPSHGSILPCLGLLRKPVVRAFSKVSVDRAFPRKRFSGALLTEPLLPTFRDLSMTSRARFRLTSGSRPPRTVLCVLSDEPRGLQLTALHPHRLRRLVWRPSPTTSQGYGEHARPFPMPVVMIGGIQLSRPCEPCSGGRLGLEPREACPV